MNDEFAACAFYGGTKLCRAALILCNGVEEINDSVVGWIEI